MARKTVAYLEAEIARYKGLYEEVSGLYRGSETNKRQIMEESERRAKRASDAEQEVKWLRQLVQYQQDTIRNLSDTIRVRS